MTDVPGRLTRPVQPETPAPGTLPIDTKGLPIQAIVEALLERADELGLRWRLVPATVSPPSDAGQTRVTYDGDTEPIDAVSMIGRLPVGARVYVVVSPPAGVHIVGFMGYDFPPSQYREAVGRPRLVVMETDFETPANSLTSVAVPGLSFAVVAGAQYLVHLRVSVGGATAAKAKFSWSGPAGAVMERYNLSVPPAETVNQAAGTFTSIRRGLATEQPTAVTGTTAAGAIPNTGSSPFPGYWEDCWLTTQSAGTMTLMAGQAVLNATPTIVRGSSWIEVQRYA